MAERERQAGFTPIFDEVAGELGIVAAAVYGCVWRHTQMRRQVCSASYQTIADLLGVSPRTVQTHIKALQKAGWIERVKAPTPRLPGEYVCGRLPICTVPQARTSYETYLQSPEWDRKRKAALKRAEYHCQLCNGQEKLNVHHRTYDRLGHERSADLIVLCENCHAQFHGKLNEE